MQNDYIPRFAYAGTLIGNQQQFGTNNAPFFNYNTTIEWIDNVTKVWNRHVVKGGIYIQRSRKDQTVVRQLQRRYQLRRQLQQPLRHRLRLRQHGARRLLHFKQASQYAHRQVPLHQRRMVPAGHLQSQSPPDAGLRPALPVDPAAVRRRPADIHVPAGEVRPQAGAAHLSPRPALPANRQAIDPLTGQILNGTYIGKIVTGTGNLLNGIAQAGKGVNKYLMKNRGIHYAPRFGFA